MTRTVSLRTLTGAVAATALLSSIATANITPQVPAANIAAVHLAPGEQVTVIADTPEVTPSAAPSEMPKSSFSPAPTSTPTVTVPPSPTAPASSPSSAPPSVSPSPGSASIYGSAIAGDTKANLRLDGNRVAHRFRATTTSTVTSVRWQQRGGSGYSLGTCGKVRVSLQADNGSGPSGTILGSGTYGPKCPSGGIFDLTTLGGATTAGQLYDIVFENTDPSPSKNYISVNEFFVYNGLTPRQPRFPDSDYAVLYGTTSWQVQSKYTADMDISYANGAHDGQSYIGMIGINGQAVYAATISGGSMVRETLGTPGFAVSTASVRVRRDHGTDPLSVSLISNGQVVGFGQVPASQVPQSAAGGDNGGSVWVTVTFPAVSFSGGELRLSTAASSAYTAAPIRDGSDSGFAPSLGFPDGAFQVSSNSGAMWAAAYSANVLDLQFYLR